MSSPVKFKYRIVIGEDATYPYEVEKKGWVFWSSKTKFRTKEEAEEQIKKMARLEIMKPGTVVFELNEEDYLAEILKNGRPPSSL